MDSLEFTWIHSDSLGFTWTHLDSLGLTWTHLDSLGFTWTHLDSLGFTWTHWNSHGLTWIHLDSLGLTWIHLDSLGLTWTHSDSHGLTGTHLDSPGLTWTHSDSHGLTETHLDSLDSPGRKTPGCDSPGRKTPGCEIENHCTEASALCSPRAPFLWKAQSEPPGAPYHDAWGQNSLGGSIGSEFMSNSRRGVEAWSASDSYRTVTSAVTVRLVPYQCPMSVGYPKGSPWDHGDAPICSCATGPKEGLFGPRLLGEHGIWHAPAWIPIRRA